MTAPGTARLRAAALVALVLAYLQIVFGAIVRITGSGMGCGDHWPKCLGQFFPPLDHPELVIEWTHRLLALLLTVAAVVLLALAVAARRRDRTGPSPDVRRPAALALLLIVVTALLGWATVAHFLAAPPVVVHLSLAMTVLATFVWIALRTGALGGGEMAGAAVTRRTRSSTTAAAAIVFLVVVLGALTAHIPGAAGACSGFPHCREVFADGAPLWVHLTHRLLAFALLFHIIGVVIGTRRRGEPQPVRRAAVLTLVVVIVQVLLAAAMVEMRFPPMLRALHQAIGTLVWLVVFTLAGLTWLGGREQRELA